MIPRQVHAAIDVAYGVVLIALAWAGDFSDARLLTGVCVGTGAAVLLLGLQTDYEPAAVRIVPMRVHLLLDLVVAFFLIGTAVGVAVGNGGGRMWAPLLGLGIAGVAVTALSDPGPLPERAQDGRVRHDDARGVLQ
jgi:hypothetical protein